MMPEEKARVKIDKQMRSAGWDIVSRGEYISRSTSAVKEALMQGNTESDYLLFIDDKAVAVLEAKKEDNPLGPEVEKQAEGYAVHPQSWYGLWVDGLIPLVYMANGNKIYFKNMLLPDSVKLLWSFLLTARSTQYDSVVFAESINQYLGPAGSVKHRRLAIKYAPVKCSLEHVFYICCITILFSGGFEIFCFYLSSIYV